MQFSLTPGTHLTRTRHGIRIGLAPGRALTVPAPPDAPADPAPDASPERVLALLTAASTQALDRRGLTWRAGEEWRRTLPAPSEEHRWVRHALAALARTPGADAAEAIRRARARRAVRVSVLSYGTATSADLAADLAQGLTRAGVRAPRRHSSALVPEPLPAAGAGPVVLVGVGEPARSSVDACVRAAVPHLLVRFTEGDATLGPFVQPGRTACLRCVDAAHTDLDPDWPLVVEQHARLARPGRRERLPEPLDPALVAVALGLALREVLTFVDGDHPATAGATLHLGADLTAVSTRPWPLRPGCGCAWS